MSDIEAKTKLTDQNVQEIRVGIKTQIAITENSSGRAVMSANDLYKIMRVYLLVVEDLIVARAECRDLREQLSADPDLKYGAT